MAFAATGKWVARFRVRGVSDRVANFTARGTFIDYATAVAAFGTLRAALDAVSAGVIYAGSLVEEYEDTAVSYGTVSVSERAVLRGQIASSTKPVTLAFPAPTTDVRIGLTGEDYNEIDLADTDIAALWDAFSGTGWEISDGEHTKATPDGLRGGRVTAAGSTP